MNVPLFALLILALSASMAAAQPATTNATITGATADVRVLTFNIRNSGAMDLANAWRFRRDFVIETIRDHDADVIGLQEVLADQADFVRERMPDYGFIGTGRDDNERAGEFSPILFRLSRYELIDSGQSWLSDTPDAVASVGWDAALPRIMTWATLRDRTTGKPVLVANTHWDHRGERARVESARLMRRLIAARSGLIERESPSPVIAMGDFNCTESDEPYRAMVGDGFDRWLDTYRVAHPEPQADEASFNGFDGRTIGKRIDWILVSSDWNVLAATIDRRANADGRYPSDHYPVTARITLR